MKDFRNLQVWHKAHSLVLEIYRTTAAFPRDELHGLTSQARRACSSIALNLAEGAGRNSSADFGRFCCIAMGSASELEYLLLLTKDLHLIGSDQYTELSERTIEIKRMLAALQKKLNADR